MTRGEKTQIIGGAIAFVPYLVLAWGVTKLDEALSFWIALGVLVGIRAFFGIVETVGRVLAWRLHGRGKAIEGILEILRANQFPKRKFRDDDFLDYLAGVENDDTVRPELRSTAREMHSLIAVSETVGMLAGWRTLSASEAALELYSPKAQAPEFGAKPAEDRES